MGVKFSASRLAIETVKMEFPNFDVLQCFVIFYVGKRRKGADNHHAYQTLPDDVCLKKIAKFFAVNAETLASELSAHTQIANRKHATLQCTIPEAWRLAVVIG